MASLSISQSTSKTPIPISISIEEKNPSVSMERTSKIIRRSIYTFLQNYQYFTCTIALLVFPVSASILLSQAFNPSSSPFFRTIHTRLRTLFDAAGFPHSSQFFSLLNLKLSQTISSSIFTLPFTLSILLIAKSFIIQSLHYHKPSLSPSFSSLISLYNQLLLTHVCNSIIIISTNAASFFILFLAFNSLEVFIFSSPYLLFFLATFGAVLYSVILANTLITCNLALIVAGMENCSGYLAILKACVLIKGKASIALFLALPSNLAMAAIEALFQYRVLRAYHLSGKLQPSMAFEGVLIAYLYSLLVILETIASCIFFKSCRSVSQTDQDGRYYYRITCTEEDDSSFRNLRNLQELP